MSLSRKSQTESRDTHRCRSYQGWVSCHVLLICGCPGFVRVLISGFGKIIAVLAPKVFPINAIRVFVRLRETIFADLFD